MARVTKRQGVTCLKLEGRQISPRRNQSSQAPAHICGLQPGWGAESWGAESCEPFPEGWTWPHKDVCDRGARGFSGPWGLPLTAELPSSALLGPFPGRKGPTVQTFRESGWRFRNR